MPIPCASPNSMSLPSFICVCALVSKIREFNQRKKKKKVNNLGNRQFNPFPIVKMDPFFD